jgi:alkylation response protein AidB-like acyl-CoA dehydrogenase
MFNKSMADMPAVRLRLGELLSDLQLMEAAYERMIYRYSKMSPEERNAKLGGQTAALKYAVTRGTGRICDQACNLMGGRSMVEDGLGVTVNRVFRAYKIFSIGGGTEDAMLDLQARQALKMVPPTSRI